MTKFKILQKIKHINGGIYRIKKLPDHRKLEHNAESFYEYEEVASGEVWIRSKTEMEDGRFLVI